MPNAFAQSPVINSPFRAPERHFLLNDDGSPTGVMQQGRRPSAYFVPIPPARKKGRARQVELALEEDRGGERITQNDFINEVRGYVERWRDLPAAQWGVSHETARLLLLAGAAAVVSGGIWRVLPRLHVAVEAVVVVGSFGLIYLGLARWWAAEEMSFWIGRLGRRLRR